MKSGRSMGLSVTLRSHNVQLTCSRYRASKHILFPRDPLHWKGNGSMGELKLAPSWPALPPPK